MRAPVSTGSSLCWAISFALVAPAAGLDEEPRRMQSDECEPPYNACPNCCDIDASCECDFHCPNHPEAWARGCSVPKIGAPTNVTCPAGYTTCAECCDIEHDCSCDAQCDDDEDGQFPDGFNCAIGHGLDPYTSTAIDAACPGGYTECGQSCALDASCENCGSIVAHGIGATRLR